MPAGSYTFSAGTRAMFRTLTNMLKYMKAKPDYVCEDKLALCMKSTEIPNGLIQWCDAAGVEVFLAKEEKKAS